MRPWSHLWIQGCSPTSRAGGWTFGGLVAGGGVSLSLFFFFFFFCFLGSHPRHMEVPRPGVKLEPQLLPAYTTATATWDLSCICDLHHSSRQCQIYNALGKARDQTGILMDTSQLLNPLRHNRNSTNHNFKLYTPTDTQRHPIFEGV